VGLGVDARHLLHHAQGFLLIMKRIARGFSILEVVIVVAIIGILLSLGVPSFYNYTQNLQIRAAAEAISAGLQIAKNEAIRRNVPVQIALDNTNLGTSWRINLASDPEANPLQSRDANEGSVNVTRTITPNGAYAITFNGMGRVAPTNADGTLAITQVDLDNLQIANDADKRKLRILIPVGGAVRMCDPLVTTPSDPRICP
jgi:type IV fimbrial biogenesis protein FimT